MRRVLLDTNIILDIALKRFPHFEISSKIFELIDLKQIQAHITATTVTDIYYIAKKEKGNQLAIEFVINLIDIVEVIGVDKIVIQKALKSGFTDFEDAVQASAAAFNDIATIITRNKSDYSNTDLTILSPEELLGFHQ